MCEACSDEGAVCARGPRRKLRAIDGPLLCSVVGTCLTPSDLRPIERRLNIDALKDAPEYQIHGNFVLWAGESGPAARQMYKMLERRYAAAIRRSATATDPAGLLALWSQSLEDAPSARAGSARPPSCRCAPAACLRSSTACGNCRRGTQVPRAGLTVRHKTQP